MVFTQTHVYIVGLLILQILLSGMSSQSRYISCMDTIFKTSQIFLLRLRAKIHKSISHNKFLLWFITYRKQQKFHGTKLSRFLRIFNKTRKFSLLILGYGTSCNTFVRRRRYVAGSLWSIRPGSWQEFNRVTATA